MVTQVVLHGVYLGRCYAHELVSHCVYRKITAVLGHCGNPQVKLLLFPTAFLEQFNRPVAISIVSEIRSSLSATL